MKKKLPVLLFLPLIIFPNLLFAQYTQQGPKLVGSYTTGHASYEGQSVAISSDGNTAIIGGAGEGAIWIFTRIGSVWTESQKLTGTGTVGTGNSYQGYSVAISTDGHTIVEGGILDNNSIGAIWIFVQNGGIWTQQGPKLVGTVAVGYSSQGYSVAISSDGNTVVVGGYGDSTFAGAIWIFIRNRGVWTQQGPKLVGTGAVYGAEQGSAVAISSDGNTVIEGGQYDNGGTGATWVFTRSGNVWTQQGQKLIGTGGPGNFDNQGTSVAISSDGNSAFVGGPQDSLEVGAIWIFTRNGGVWTQQGTRLVGSGRLGNSHQGTSLAISSDGNTLVEGGSGDNNDAGAIWVFTRSGSLWTQLGTKLVGTGSVGNALQGTSVAISALGNTIIQGGNWDNNLVGAAWVFYNPTIGISPISNELPKGFSLSQNYPNPFNPTTIIRFDIAPPLRTNGAPLPLTGGDVTAVAGTVGVKLEIYDILGKEIITLVNQQLQPGTYEVSFDGTNMPSGIYFYRLESGSFVETKKMSLIK